MDKTQTGGLRELLDACMTFTVDGKPMFKALTYHSNGEWSGEYRTWSKLHRKKWRNFAKTPEQALTDLLGILSSWTLRTEREAQQEAVPPTVDTDHD